MRKHELLFKTVMISLAFHVTGISIFHIVFPLRRPSKPPIEVALLPAFMAPEEAEVVVPEVVPEIPSTLYHSYQTVDYIDKMESVVFALKPFTGFPEPVPFVKMAPEFKIPEFEVDFSEISEFFVQVAEVVENFSGLDIEGPAGERQLIYREAMDYPDWARMAGFEGTVRMRFFVAPDGKVVRTEMLTSSGAPELDTYVEDGFRRWVFEPAVTDKDVWGIITFRFRLI